MTGRMGGGKRSCTDPVHSSPVNQSVLLVVLIQQVMRPPPPLAVCPHTSPCIPEWVTP